MKRTTFGWASLLGTLLVAACAGAEGESGTTESTTRSLLSNSETVGGPSTPVEGDPSLTARAGPTTIEELGYNLGSADAPLKLIEFSDFGCGYCRRFHEESFEPLQTEFVETGRVEWKFMPFITGMFDNSLAVTEVAECTLEQNEGLFEAVSQQLWSRQSEWKGSSEPSPLVRGWAGELGADLDTLDSCLDEDRRITRIATATAVAEQIGIRGTPTFWLVGYGPLQGALPLETFQEVLGAVLEQAEAERDAQSADPTVVDSTNAS
jgi:protein-disulfide isomerase